MMKIVSWNVNGLRSVGKKGFSSWLKKADADIVCLQEVKATPDKIDDPEILTPDGYELYWASAKKPGYSGLLIYSRIKPMGPARVMGIDKFDSEGRVLMLDFKKFTLINSYFPNSQRDHSRLPYKLEFCDSMLEILEGLRRQKRNIVICGDFNIAHHEIDLKNPKTNLNNAGFLPQERAWMTRFVETGYVDTFREFETAGGHYTWWSYRPGVREKNIGWRLDYFFVNREFAGEIKTMGHSPEVHGSDHCPIVLQLNS